MQLVIRAVADLFLVRVLTPSPSNYERGRISIGALRLCFVVIFLTHIAVGFLLYRWRVISDSAIADSDWLIFGLPFWLAFGSYCFVFVTSSYLRPRSLYRQIGLVVLSFASAFGSFWLYMFLALNTYGS
jgi:hypothetical protein